MSKCEKYWLFGMVLMLSITHQETPTLLGSIGNVIAFLAAIMYFALAGWNLIRGAK